jgi:hypothetical protein
MRKVVLSSICAAAIALSGVSGAFAQGAGTSPGAPASNQPGVTNPGPSSSDATAMAKKKKTKKSSKKSGAMKKM